MRAPGGTRPPPAGLDTKSPAPGREPGGGSEKLGLAVLGKEEIAVFVEVELDAIAQFYFVGIP